MYTIYEIPGVKIGCTRRTPIERVKEQGYQEFIILEVHEDIKIASIREAELQKQYGYRVDETKYHKVIAMPTKESCSKGGQKAKSLKLGICGLDYESRKKGGYKGGKAHIESGHLKKITLQLRKTDMETANKIRQEDISQGLRTIARKYELPYSTVRGIIKRLTYLD